ncbi:DMT family transporter [Pseudomonas sp. MAP12]|uniref:DMT family transporter n=1 Tax=Geopseudomonas aromaticivorans TaxID=2849492 RepID=A0ABS6MZA1_9GAMM|nr:DMT family transporter [Pseudomonas aromaticivorans]MBV2133860.1 DMT family transporter [Pseudomonas aromaticivorans]
MSLPSWFLLALPLLSGAMMPLQAGVNGQLARHIDSVLSASLISFLVGSLALLIITLTQRDLPSGLAPFKGLSWWHWTGGLLGVLFVVSAAFAGPRIGALLFMSLVLAGQLSAALLLDHFGWAGFPQASVSLGKLAGLVLIVAGVWLIRRG